MEKEKQETAKKRLVIFFLIVVWSISPFGLLSESYLVYTCEPSVPYVGQQVLLKAWVLSREDVLSVQWKAEPDLSGFWKEEVKITSPQVESMNFKGKFFWAYLVKKAVLFPLKEGLLRIEGGKVEVEFQKRKKEILRGEKLVLKVRPVPPVDAVGKIYVKAHLKEKEVRAGTLFRIVVVVEGETNFKLLPWPRVEKIKSLLRLSKSQNETEVYFSEDRLKGRKVFLYSGEALKPGDYLIPSFSYKMFNPETGMTYIASSAPLKIKIQSSTLASSMGVKPLKPNQGRRPFLLVESTTFWILFLMALCFSAGFYLKKPLLKIFLLTKAKLQQKQACFALKRMEERALKMGKKEFYAELKKLLRICLGVKHISQEELAYALKDVKKEGVKDSWYRWWEELQHIEFSPGEDSLQERKVFLEKLKKLLDEVK